MSDADELMALGMSDAEVALTTEGFAALQQNTLEKAVSVYPARAWYPCSIDHPCDRFLVWNFTRWETKARHEPTLQSIFDEGRMHQPDIYARLEKMGFRIVRESDRPTQYKLKGGARISGRSDGRIIGFRDAKLDPQAILEAKSASPFTWERLRTAEDIRTDRDHWTRGYYGQGQVYALLENVPRVAFVLKNKLTGLLKVIMADLDMAYAEGILKRVERLQPMVDQGVDPEPIPYDRAICGGCGFLTQCYPPRSYGEGVELVEVSGLLDLLEERDKHAAGHAEYEAADRAVKAILKREGIKFGLCGPFVIDGKVIAKKEYTVPAQEQTQYSIRRTPQSEIPA